ncbi:hypothetical protein KBC03_02060 [Patescibacteria group bacterium]|nr:hypothetical protein [Patescibacteria group bacterium]
MKKLISFTSIIMLTIISNISYAAGPWWTQTNAHMYGQHPTLYTPAEKWTSGGSIIGAFCLAALCLTGIGKKTWQIIWLSAFSSMMASIVLLWLFNLIGSHQFTSCTCGMLIVGLGGGLFLRHLDKHSEIPGTYKMTHKSTSP